MILSTIYVLRGIMFTSGRTQALSSNYFIHTLNITWNTLAKSVKLACRLKTCTFSVRQIFKRLTFGIFISRFPAPCWCSRALGEIKINRIHEIFFFHIYLYRVKPIINLNCSTLEPCPKITTYKKHDNTSNIINKIRIMIWYNHCKIIQPYNTSIITLYNVQKRIHRYNIENDHR